MSKDKTKTKNRYLETGALLFGLLLVAYEFLSPSLGNDALENKLWDITVTRLLGATVFLMLCIRVSYKIFGTCDRRALTGMLLSLPALLVVVNNLPIIGLISGEAKVERVDLIPLFILECVAIGLYEEIVFRGFVFPYIMEKAGTSRRGIFISIITSCAIFGAMHLLNLIEGAGVGATFLQIGYSFLIGAMCSVVLVKTQNIWVCCILHAIYDFCGFLIPELGKGKIWDTATVIITALLGVFTAVYMVCIFFKTDLSLAEKIVHNDKN